MPGLASCSTLYRDQNNTLPSIRLRDIPSSQGFTLPSIQLAGQTGVEWQEPNSQQLQPSPYIEPRSSFSTEEERRTSAPTWKSEWHSKLNPIEPVLRFQNGPDTVFDSPLSTVDPVPPSTSTVHTFSDQKQLCNTSPRADGAATLARGARTIWTPESPSHANALRAAIFEDAGSLPLSPTSEREYKANPIPLTSLMHAILTPPTQFNEQKYGSTSSSRNLTDALRVSEGTKQAPTSPASSLYSKVGRRPRPSNLDSSELSLVTTVQPGGVMQSQGLPRGPYVTAVTQAQDSSRSAVNSKQMSASNPIQIMTITSTEGSYDWPVDVLVASRAADEKRARNAGASARFRQRRKEKENEANNVIARQDRKIKELEQERNFYRDDRDRLRDVVLQTPGLEHHARWGPSSPQAMRSAPFQKPLPQMAISQAPPQVALQATDPTSQRASKRRRPNTRGGHIGTNEFPPTTTPTPVQVGYSSRPALPSPKTTSNTLLEGTTCSQRFNPHAIGIYNQEWPVDWGRYATLSGCLNETQHTSHHLTTSIPFNFPSSNLPSHVFNKSISAVTLTVYFYG